MPDSLERTAERLTTPCGDGEMVWRYRDLDPGAAMPTNGVVGVQRDGAGAGLAARLGATAGGLAGLLTGLSAAGLLVSAAGAAGLLAGLSADVAELWRVSAA